MLPRELVRSPPRRGDCAGDRRKSLPLLLYPDPSIFASFTLRPHAGGAAGTFRSGRAAPRPWGIAVLLCGDGCLGESARGALSTARVSCALVSMLVGFAVCLSEPSVLPNRAIMASTDMLYPLKSSIKECKNALSAQRIMGPSNGSLVALSFSYSFSRTVAKRFFSSNLRIFAFRISSRKRTDSVRILRTSSRLRPSALFLESVCAWAMDITLSSWSRFLLSSVSLVILNTSGLFSTYSPAQVKPCFRVSLLDLVFFISLTMLISCTGAVSLTSSRKFSLVECLTPQSV